MAANYRQILPKPGGSSTTAAPTEKDPAAKRQTVSLACQRCRSRKIKCDGERPSCATCHTKQVDCLYHDSPETTTHALLLKEYRSLEQRHRELLELYEMLKSRPEPEAIVIFRRLRDGHEVRSLLSLVKDGDMVTELRHPATTKAALGASNVRRPSIASSAPSEVSSRSSRGFPDMKLLNPEIDGE